MNGKSRFFRLHAKRRLSRRYGLNPSNDDARELRRLITSGKADVLHVKKNGVNRMTVRFKGRILYLLFDPLKQQILTFLTPPGSRQRCRKDRRTMTFVNQGRRAIRR